MLHLIINLIHHHIPISQLITTLLKIRTLGNILQQHGMDIKGIVGTGEGYHVFEVRASAAFFDGGGKGFFGAALAVLDVGFLTPEGGARHGIWMEGMRRRVGGTGRRQKLIRCRRNRQNESAGRGTKVEHSIKN